MPDRTSPPSGSTTTCHGCAVEIPRPRRGRRKWCSEACRRRTLYGGTCIDCGVQISEVCNANPPTRCRPCSHAHAARTVDSRPSVAAARARQLQMLEQWKAGCTAKQIAAEFNTSAGTVTQTMTRLRKYGYDVPAHRKGNASHLRQADPRRLSA